VRTYFRRLTRWRVAVGWYDVALLAPMAGWALVAYLNVLRGRRSRSEPRDRSESGATCPTRGERGPGADGGTHTLETVPWNRQLPGSHIEALARLDVLGGVVRDAVQLTDTQNCRSAVGALESH
jgi:hypothetical protein